MYESNLYPEEGLPLRAMAAYLRAGLCQGGLDVNFRFIHDHSGKFPFFASFGAKK